MAAISNPGHRSGKATKVRALLAGGLVLGIGAAFTLAAWTDNEWVFGQSDNGGGPGTKTYHMEQNTWTGAAGIDAWSDQGSKDGGALTFAVNADKLVPGATVYAPMQLRAAAGSEALTATLAEGVQSAPADAVTNSTALYGALTYEAKKLVGKASCNAAGFAGAGTTLVAASSALTASSAVAIDLPAGADATTAGSGVDVCFAITLPAGAASSLQGLKTVPLWRFTSTVGS
ncbi:SipW-dependent-type signal peptide-containing protein [Arthrobacter cavernae]|uniref:SipW-dependent-type signal peptide-containing protein n=1 Tax=Arthrobacter cavernae TaxID=2817681 RepID=UPI0027DE6684|nr:SipW-dependent-type signal peptide-containing protein [Arthrobacter cavernae]